MMEHLAGPDIMLGGDIVKPSHVILNVVAKRASQSVVVGKNGFREANRNFGDVSRTVPYLTANPVEYRTETLGVA